LKSLLRRAIEFLSEKRLNSIIATEQDEKERQTAMKIKWEAISIRTLAAVISDALRKKDIEVTLVGGACVSIYAKKQ